MIISRRHLAFLVSTEETRWGVGCRSPAWLCPSRLMAVPRLDPHCLGCCLLPPLPLGNPAWLQGMQLGWEFHKICRQVWLQSPPYPLCVNFIRSIGKSDCRALLIPFLQVSSWTSHLSCTGWMGVGISIPQQHQDAAAVSSGSQVVPETVPLLQPCLSWVSCKSGTHSWSWETSHFPQLLSTYLKPDSQSVKFPLQCEMKERQGRFWQWLPRESRIYPWFPLWPEDTHDPAGSKTGVPGLSGADTKGMWCLQAVTSVSPSHWPALCSESYVAISFLPNPTPTPTPCQVPPPTEQHFHLQLSLLSPSLFQKTATSFIIYVFFFSRT